MINAILIDDEPGCLQNLQYYLEEWCPEIRVSATTTDLASASKLIRTQDVQVAFLDVQLYNCTAFDFLLTGTMPEIPIVFVTAYEKYAVDAFRVSALDYILKPLERSEIQRCYEKVLRYFSAFPAAGPARQPRIMLRQGDHVYVIDPEQICFLQAQGFYTKVCFESQGRVRTVLMAKPINALHNDWQYPQLLRVHRSYVVNLHRITAVRKSGGALQLDISDRSIPVAKRRTPDFLDRYES